MPVADKPAVGETFGTVTERNLMRDRFRQILDGSRTYSMKRSLVSMEGLVDALHTPATKRMRSNTIVHTSDEGLMVADVDADQPTGEADDGNGRLYFRVVLSQSKKKRLRTRVGAAGRIDKHHMAVSVLSALHEFSDACGDTPVIASAVGDSSSSPFLLDALVGEPVELENSVLQWGENATLWTIAGHAHMQAVPNDISELLGQYISAGAYPGVHNTRGLILKSEYVQANKELQQRKYVEGFNVAGIHQWYLTAKGLQNMSTARRLGISPFILACSIFMPPVDSPWGAVTAR